MQIERIIRQRLADALARISPGATEFAQLVRPTQDPGLGDFQINSAMPLGKQIGKPPREVAADIVEHLAADDFLEPAEIAGPGFINLRLRDDWIATAAARMLADDRFDIPEVDRPQRILLDYSSPNVAKPMHVGHIRSTVIGDALARILRFLGHHTITDNHLGDWGTQFGMVIYGYRNFLDSAAFQQEPVLELLRVYRIVNSLIEYHKAMEGIAEAEQKVAAAQLEVDAADQAVASAKPEDVKKARAALAAAQRRAKAVADSYAALRKRIAAVQEDDQLLREATAHREIASGVLEETAKLHAGDAENLRLWKELLPYCMDEINRVYERLNIQFDHTLGESFYHSMLPTVVARLREAGLAVESEGAICVFLEGFDAPMIVQKQDGAYLYATTDLATLDYRRRTFAPDEILYVVDFRQGDHFKKLFAAATQLGITDAKLVHVSFGTVLDESGRPLKTRSGTLAGLVSLLDDAVERAYGVVCSSEQAERLDPPLTEQEKREIAECVGIGAIKYADLAHHRTSDYKFSLEKMVSLDGNTAAYVQYAYARVQGILRGAGISEEAARRSAAAIRCGEPAERMLLLSLLQFEKVLHQIRDEYAPNVLVDFLYDIAKGLAGMYEQCPVLKAEDPAIRESRLAIVTLAARTLRQGLALLGIGVVPRM